MNKSLSRLRLFLQTGTCGNQYFDSEVQGWTVERFVKVQNGRPSDPDTGRTSGLIKDANARNAKA